MISTIFRLNSRIFLPNSRFLSHVTSNFTSKVANRSEYVAKSVQFSTTSCWYQNRQELTNEEKEQQQANKRRRLPALMDFQEIVWPSILKSIKNWILVNFIIRPYFDNNFVLQEFVQGSKQALQIISSSISSGTDIDSLKGLVSDEALAEIKKSVSEMSMQQRHQIECLKEDIYFSFPYQVGIMFDESADVQKRWVEITMVFHVLRGVREMVEREQSIPLNVGVDPEYRDKFSICNYRFIKEFTQNQQSDWIVNRLNHFKPIDLLPESPPSHE